MNEDIKNIIIAEYKQYGLYDVKIKKNITNGSDLYVFLDVTFRNRKNASKKYLKRDFYDYLSSEDINNSLSEYFYDNKREDKEQSELMSEENIIVIGSIEYIRYRKNGQLKKWYPHLLSSKSKYTSNFKKNIVKRVNAFGVSKTYKELNAIKGLPISKSTIYSFIKTSN